MTNPMEEWLEKAKADHKAKNKAETAARPKCQKCSTCTHFQGHPFSPKYHYCANGRSKHTGCGLAKTSPTKWCQNWKDRIAPPPPTI